MTMTLEERLRRKISRGVKKHYAETKKQVGAWLKSYILELKGLTADQKRILETIVKNPTYEQVEDFWLYTETWGVSTKAQQRKLRKYVDSIEWLPAGVDMWILDGTQICRTDQTEVYTQRVLYDAFGPEPGSVNYNPPQQMPRYVRLGVGTGGHV